MKIFYDTEFLEDGKTIELISIGMVAEDGREFYAVCEEIADDPLYSRICQHHWLMDNVVPHLPLVQRGGLAPHVVLPGPENQYPRKAGAFHLDLDDLEVMPLRQIRKQVLHFLLNPPGPDYSEIELWAWYGAYDHVALAQLWGPMIRLPKGVPMWTNDLKQECQRHGNPQLPKQESTAHNAIEDARWVRDAFFWLATSLEPPKTLQTATKQDHSSPRSPAGEPA